MTVRFFDIRLQICAAIGIAMLGAPSEVSARISGDAELGYARYEVETRGEKGSEGHSFYQKYSLLYETQGALYNGRIGRYNMALGYEWGSFDTKIKGPAATFGSQADGSYSVSTGHLLYRGEVVLDPQELPLKLRAYSYDMNRISMQQDYTAINGSSVLAPSLITDLNNGTHITSGATLLFGVKSGLTNGYNAIFRHIPLVMLDYQDILNRDTKSFTPIDTRLRRLAFVSLNKRDNWFHYRKTDYEDRINPNQSFEESQLQIGTVDQALTRRWIDLTNWLKISTDGQFTKHLSATSADSFEEYEVNLFAIASRKTWDARTFSSFSRRRDPQGISLERTIPLYAGGVLGADGDWKSSFYLNEQRIKEPDGDVVNNRNLSGSVRADMLRRSPFILGVTVKGESSENYGAKLFSFEGLTEVASTARFSRDYSLAGSYSIKYFDASGSYGSGGGYLNQHALVRAAYNPSATVLLEAEQVISAASGTNPQNFNNSAIIVNSGFNNVSTTVPGSSSSFQRRNSDIDEYVRSVTTARVSWRPLPRAAVTFGVSEDILTRSGMPTDYLTTLRNTIDYSVASVSVQLRNSYNIRMLGGESIDFLESQGTLEYRPNRTIEGSLYYLYSVGEDEPGVSSDYLDLRQRLTYSFYSFNGANRKLLELSQEFTYNRTKSDYSLSSSVNSDKRFTLGARYYPLRSLFVGATGQYSLIDPGSIVEQAYTGTIGLSFRKFQASLDYSYGKRNGGDNRVEKRIAANMKKIF
ncbi:hypothetical protein RHDC3_02604 [Rhodocyclaceae bacterium]|nr:hypothetical protein RHDC3_02604 [Rhodocyclaceae bacterium]